eukprot:CAMPEP_0168814752 /NCGR_PEP_ID=MMETSP0726-20121227/5842_1 /TAXON_ID=265536 /ORGANISM="Amphiprora sp., Strain CCMP467" /LENGTH=450 /DNA_ID=CAMNT_0008866935 /DNA_START=310 /DNA_END=1659 /DNA_ORIENTATION=+
MNLQRARRRVLAVAAWVLFWNHVGVVRANEKDDGTDGDPMMTMTTDVDVNQTNNDSPPQKICFNGYVMDYYCIGRGTLLDAPSRNTLEYPDRHSIHCLVDVGSCRNNGYEVLLDPPNPSESRIHARVFTLDDTGNQKVIDLARSIGDCSSCPRNDVNQGDGFRATVLGYIDNTTAAPQLLRVTELRLDSEPCTPEEGGQYVPLVTSSDVGFNGVGIDPVVLHGSLMIVAWGILVPIAVLSSILFRHKPRTGVWFIIHRLCNGLALFLTIVGILYAFVKFGNVFQEGAKPSKRHGTLGMTTFSCAMIQLMMGLCRPHLPDSEGQPAQKTRQRTIFEVMHRGLGYSTVALAYTTLYFGAQVSGTSRDRFMAAWYAVLGFPVAVAAWMLWDKFQHRHLHEELPQPLSQRNKSQEQLKRVSSSLSSGPPGDEATDPELAEPPAVESMPDDDADV